MGRQKLSAAAFRAFRAAVVVMVVLTGAGLLGAGPFVVAASLVVQLVEFATGNHADAEERTDFLDDPRARTAGLHEGPVRHLGPEAVA